MAAGKNSKSVGFGEFINTDRERKKNEALAAKVFGKGRRNSAPGAAASGNKKTGAGPSLASRVGIQKQRSASTFTPRQKTKAAGNVDVEWTHDLHSLNNPSASRVSQLSRQNSKGGRGQARNGQRLLAAINNSPASGNSQFNIVNKPRLSGGISIRGIAGPYTVLARNFAPGTTAADIESAMAPHGGEIRSCSIVSHSPTTAELVFESKEGADNVIETFHNQTADGRLLSVFYKPTTLSQPALPVTEKLRSVHIARPSPPTGPRADVNSERSGGRYPNDRYQPRERSRERRRSYERAEVQDGSYGFEEKMDLDDADDGRGLYSDDLVGSRNNTRGRGDRDNGRGRESGRRYR